MKRRRLGKMDCATKERMKVNAIKVWLHDDDEVKNMCTNLMESIRRRIQDVFEDVISSKEGHTSYKYRYYSVYIKA